MRNIVDAISIQVQYSVYCESSIHDPNVHRQINDFVAINCHSNRRNVKWIWLCRQRLEWQYKHILSEKQIRIRDHDKKFDKLNIDKDFVVERARSVAPAYGRRRSGKLNTRKIESEKNTV